ncbi:hypothetical protein B0H14DRAFT_3450731 [Mycena olivaceomarginata]|nr:hypothetical protein B0H14DRAFT_3450731 [Mycena olivaceomarginata]
MTIPQIAEVEKFFGCVHIIAFIAEGPLAAALKDDLTRHITLGFKMIAGLSACTILAFKGYQWLL